MVQAGRTDPPRRRVPKNSLVRGRRCVLQTSDPQAAYQNVACMCVAIICSGIHSQPSRAFIRSICKLLWWAGIRGGERGIVERRIQQLTITASGALEQSSGTSTQQINYVCSENLQQPDVAVPPSQHLQGHEVHGPSWHEYWAWAQASSCWPFFCTPSLGVRRTRRQARKLKI